jgi:hypothetical protein
MPEERGEVSKGTHGGRITDEKMKANRIAKHSRYLKNRATRAEENKERASGGGRKK